MRTTINIAEEILKEAEELYNTTNRSNAIETALKDAIRFKKLQMLMDLKNRIEFDEKTVEHLRRAEIDETNNG